MPQTDRRFSWPHNGIRRMCRYVETPEIRGSGKCGDAPFKSNRIRSLPFGLAQDGDRVDLERHGYAFKIKTASKLKARKIAISL